MKLQKNNDLFTYQLDSKKLSCSFQETADRSPSLILHYNNSQSELMHSRQGAFSETIYVYEPVINFVTTNKLQPVFMSIGLGIGYIEILIIAYLIKKESELLKDKNFFIYSFESESLLISFFRNFFTNKALPEEFVACYLKIINLTSNYLNIEKENLFIEIKKAILNNKIVFCSKFNKETVIDIPVSGIFFDAFSAESSPDLWEKDIIKNIISKSNCNNKAVFATYASRSLLKNILKENNFILRKRKGFSGKRECILAERL